MMLLGLSGIDQNNMVHNGYRIRDFFDIVNRFWGYPAKDCRIVEVDRFHQIARVLKYKTHGVAESPCV